MNAQRLFSTARELRDVAAAVPFSAGGLPGEQPARFIAPGVNIRTVCGTAGV
nr:conjugative transfer relaxase/helicase TraI domain-containing protein [Escherichia coli]